MAQDTLPSRQVWDRLQQAATTGSLEELKAGLAQLDDLKPDEIATWFVPNMAERHLLPTSPSSSSPPSDHHHLLPLLHRLLTLTSRHGHLPLTTDLLDTHPSLPVTSPVVRGALSHRHWATMQLFLDRGLWDVNQPVEGGNTLPVLKEVIASEEHVRWLLARGADPAARSVGRNLDVPSAAARRLVPVGVWRLLNDGGKGEGVLKRSDALHRVVEVKREGFAMQAKGAGEGEWEGRLRDVIGFLVDEAGFPLGQLEYSYDEGLFEEWNGIKALGTPLHCAVKAGNEEAVKCLLEKGADRDAKDTRGRTAVDLAREAQGGEDGAMMGLLMG